MRLFSFSLLLVGLLAAFASAAADQSASVGLVIEHGDGAIVSRCVPVDSGAMSLSRLLGKAGIVFSSTASDNFLSNVDFEGGVAGRAWYATHKSAAGQTVPRATDLASLRFGAGDLAYLQYADGPRTDAPATFSEACDVRSRAALVVVHSSGEITRKCVAFPGETTTAGRLLDLSGIPAVIASFPFGRAICAIDGEGCPEGDCFGCDEKGRFWGLFLRGGDGRAISSNYGADQTTVLAGDVVVFYYAEFGKNPPIESFGQTCGHDAELSANLHVLDGLSFAVVATALSPYHLGDATHPAQLRLVLPPGLLLLSSGDPAALQSVDRRDMAAAWVVGQASPEAGRVYHLRVQLETAASEEHTELGWRSSGGKLSDANHDGRVDKDDLLILRQEWE